MSERGTVRLELPGQPMSPDAVARWHEEFAAAGAERKRREHQQTEKVELVVGMHAGRGGSTKYCSEFVRVGEAPIGGLGVVYFGSLPVTEERCVCSCVLCGVMFDPAFVSYRDQVTAYRNRP